MDFQRFFDAFDAQTKSVAVLTQRVEELRLSNLQLLQAVKKAERLPHILDPESKKLANRFREQALAYEREITRQQRAKKMAQIEREMAASRVKDQGPVRSDVGPKPSQPQREPAVHTTGRPVPSHQAPFVPIVASTGGGISTSMSTEDELSNTVIAKDRLDFFRQVGSGATHGTPDNIAVAGSLLDQVNLESPSVGQDDGLEGEDVSVDLGANTTTGTGFYTNSTDILQYMRHSTNTITSMFTLQEEEEETESSHRQPTPGRLQEPVAGSSGPVRPVPHGGGAEGVNGERQHLTRYLMEASLPDNEDELPHDGTRMDAVQLGAAKPRPGHPWDSLMEAQLEAQAQLGMKLQEEIRAQEERLRAQMQLFNQMRHNSAAASRRSPELSEARPLSRHTPSFPAVVRSEEESLRLVHPPLPSEESMGPELHAKFCRLSALVKGHLTRLLYNSDKVQTVLRTIKDTAECALYLSESSDVSSSAVARRQDAFLHSRLVSQLQAALFEFHDIFFSSTPAHRMALIAATREAKRNRRLHQEEQEVESERDSPDRLEASDKHPPKLSAATLRRIEMRQKGQLNSVISPRFVNRPSTAEVPAAAESIAPVRPSTAGSGPPRSQLRVLRPLPPQQQAPVRSTGQPVHRSRSLNAGAGKAPVRTAGPLKRGQPHRHTMPHANHQSGPVHVVNVRGAGKRMMRKVRAGPDAAGDSTQPRP